MLSPVELPAELRLFETFDLPAWIYDLDSGRMLWCNARALELWNAESREELCQRDLSDLSEATRARLQAYLEGNVEAWGGELRDTWTYYPRGNPTTVQSQGFAVTLPDSRRVLFFCAFYQVKQPDASQIRGVDAARHTQVMLSLLDEEAKVLYHNPAAMRAFGGKPTLTEWFAELDVVRELFARAQTEGFSEAELLALTAEGPRWHSIVFRKTRDPATGAPSMLVEQIDISRRREAEHMVAEQRRRIDLLSAPHIEVATRVLAVPLIGHLDAALVETLTDRLLSEVSVRSIAVVIVDLTGVRGFEPQGLGSLLGIVRALGLLGAKTIVTGIPTELAHALAQTQEALPGVTVLRTLREGIAAASRVLGSG